MNYLGVIYRYGFQNQEVDDEIKGEGNSVNFKYRMHDPRVGRFFAVDPLAPKYPHNSPYAFSENRVIDGIDLEGLEFFYSADGVLLGQIGTNEQVYVVKDSRDIADVKEKVEWANHQISIKGKWIASNTDYAISKSKEVKSKGTYKMVFEGSIVKSKEMTGKDLNPAKNAEYGIQGETKIVEEYTEGFDRPILESDFTSGPYGNGPTPNKDYTATKFTPTSETGMQNNAGNSGWKVYIEDFNGRDGLRIHPDCNSIGTAGCIGLRTDDATLEKFKQFFQNQLKDGGTLDVNFQIKDNPNYGNGGKANPNVGQ